MSDLHVILVYEPLGMSLRSRRTCTVLRRSLRQILTERLERHVYGEFNPPCNMASAVQGNPIISKRRPWDELVMKTSQNQPKSYTRIQEEVLIVPTRFPGCFIACLLHQ